MPVFDPNFGLLAVALAFLVLIYFNGRKRKNAIAKMKDDMKVGAKVLMAGGVKGIVAEIRDETVVIETTPGVKIEYIKAAVNTVVPPSLDEPAAPAKPKVPANTAAKKAAPKPKKPAAKTATKKTAK